MNPYQILGVPPHASLTQIKSAYRQAAGNHHP
ncbi:DnaJ domain-containing protein, partial [Chamaesiphon sp. VAR_69_metabat_338]